MAAKPEKKFCVEHGGTEQFKSDTGRIVCPFDPKHTCYLNKLQKHMKVCNSRPKVLPEYIVTDINKSDLDFVSAEDEMYSIGSVPDEVLLKLLQKLEKVYLQEIQKCEKAVLSHPVMELSLSNSELGVNSKKHLIQNSSLLKIMEENGFFHDNVSFIEFGAGRGQLGFWITKAIENNKNCNLLLIDRASHRHKSDNKLKGVSPVNTLRIRADIGDIDLSKIPFLSKSENEIFGVSKHLCGVATDLALRCVVKGMSKGLRIKGVLMAFCCHHRCSWSSFVGKEFLLHAGFSPDQFPALCSISSWATCGSGKSRLKLGVLTDLNKEHINNDRYRRFGLTPEIREDIGQKCKMILNHARLKYLEKFGFQGKLVYYVKRNISPENVCLIAKRHGSEF